MMKDFSGIDVSTVPDLALSDESKHVIKGILDSKAAEMGGVLNIDELGECLDALGFTADDEDVDFLKKHFDDNGDGELEVEELMNNIDVLNWHSFYGKRLMKEFKKIDNDGDGVIRYPEMLKVFTTRGPEPMQPKEARVLLDRLARKFDENFDGKFSYSEFVKIYMSDMLPYRDTITQSYDSSSEEEVPKWNAKKEIKKKKSGLKKRPSDPDGATIAASTAPTRGGATAAPPKSAARRRTPAAPPQPVVEPTSDLPPRPKSVWERLAVAKPAAQRQPLQKRSTYH